MWQKICDLISQHPDCILKQGITYINPMPDPLIKKIWIGSYHDEYFVIKLTSPNEAKFEELCNSMVYAGFANPRFAEQENKIYNLSTSDHNVITHFVKKIKQIQPNFSDIETEVCSLIDINLDHIEPLPTWIKSGNFQPNSHLGSLLHRCVEFTNTTAISNIKKIELRSYLSRNICIYIQTNLLNILNLKSALRSANFTVNDSVYNENLIISIPADQELQLENLFTILSPFTSNLDEIKNYISTYINLAREDDSLTVTSFSSRRFRLSCSIYPPYSIHLPARRFFSSNSYIFQDPMPPFRPQEAMLTDQSDPLTYQLSFLKPDT